MEIHFKFSKIGPINIKTATVVAPIVRPPRPRLLTVNIEVNGLQIITKKNNSSTLTIGIMIITMAAAAPAVVIDTILTIITITIEIFMVDEGKVSMAMKTNLIITTTKFSIGALVIAVAITSTIIGIRLDHLIMTTIDGDTDMIKKIQFLKKFS